MYDVILDAKLRCW